MQAQAASLTFTHVYAALVAVINTKVSILLPHDAKQSAVLPQYMYIVCPSVCLSVCDVQVPWLHMLEFFENNFTAEYPRSYARAFPNMGDLVQWERPQN